MSEEIKKIGEIQLGNTISNPFSKDGIVSLYVSTNLVIQKKKELWISYGILEFKRGNTTGRQRFEGASFDEVVLKIKHFIDNEL